MAKYKLPDRERFIESLFKLRDVVWCTHILENTDLKSSPCAVGMYNETTAVVAILLLQSYDGHIETKYFDISTEKNKNKFLDYIEDNIVFN